MALPQFAQQERRRAARHEAGHWLSYYKYGFFADGIRVDQKNTGVYAAEVEYPAPDAKAPEYLDHLKNRMRTIVAGFVAEAIPDTAGTAPDYVVATEWKPYLNYKSDYKRFDELLEDLVKLEPAPADQDARQYYFAKFSGEVMAFLAGVPAALDAIQAAVLECQSDHLEAATLKALPAVRAFIDKLEKDRRESTNHENKT